MRLLFLLICLLIVPNLAQAQPAVTLVQKTTAYGTISYPQVSNLPDEKVEQAINKQIEDVAANWTCATDEGLDIPASSTFDATSTLRLLDQTHLSFTTVLNYYCGGAYPGTLMISSNFDVHTGKAISLGDLMLPEWQGDSLTRLLVKEHKFAGGCMDERGNNIIEEIYNPEAGGVLWDYYRTQDNIVFFPQLPHAVQACFEEFSLPLEQAKAYLR